MRPPELRFRGYVKNGKLTLSSRRYFEEQLWKTEGSVVLIIESLRSQRNLKQNAYYWGVVLPIIAEHTGHTVNELHEIYKRQFLPPKIVTYKGVAREIPASTTELNVMEFADYLTRIIAEAASMGIVVPSSEEYHEENRRKTKEKIQKLIEKQQQQ
jgi:hypothetical protein